eukprot:6480552-Amphidinium_carterae.2
MDTQREAHVLEQHNTNRGEARQLDPSQELNLEDALPEESAMLLSLGTEPGAPALQLETTPSLPTQDGRASSPVPGGPVPLELNEQEPGSPVCWPVFHAEPGPISQGPGATLSGHSEDLPSLVPAVGQELALLGPTAGELLRLRRVAERRTIFAMRGQRGPDDSPFSGHSFDPTVTYRNVEWGLPVPQEEWERRVYVELNLATDLRYEGKGARPECHACRQRGSREVPLAKCICCENWACSRHYLVPACLDRIYAICSAHPGLEVRPFSNFSYLCKHW